MKKFTEVQKVWILFSMLSFPYTAIFAQIDPGGGGGLGDPDPNAKVPIDDGIIFLIAAGIILAAWTLYRFKRKKTARTIVK